MAWYVRTLSTAILYASLEEAAAQMQATVDMYSSRKQTRRTGEGKVALYERDGTLFNVLWVEDEKGQVVRYD